MLFGNDRQTLRQYYFDAWRKYKNQQAINDFETQLVHVIQQHPEYHFIFDNPEKYVDRDFFPELQESNPFLHLSLHMAILEQITTDRPSGIRQVYQQLLYTVGDPLIAEHQMIEILGATLWEMQNNYAVFDENSYLEKLKSLT